MGVVQSANHCSDFGRIAVLWAAGADGWHRAQRILPARFVTVGDRCDAAACTWVQRAVIVRRRRPVARPQLVVFSYRQPVSAPTYRLLPVDRGGVLRSSWAKFGKAPIRCESKYSTLDCESAGEKHRIEAHLDGINVSAPDSCMHGRDLFYVRPIWNADLAPHQNHMRDIIHSKFMARLVCNWPRCIIDASVNFAPRAQVSFQLYTTSYK